MSANKDRAAGPGARRQRGRGSRRRAREAALQMLYQWEVGGSDIEEVVRTFWLLDAPGRATPPPEVREFATWLARGTVASVGRIDPLIGLSAERWRLPRMAVMDRLIIRLGAYELLDGQTPPGVAINEALELTRTFSGDEAVAFVNGVLDGIKRRLEEGEGTEKVEGRKSKVEVQSKVEGRKSKVKS